MMYTVLHIMVAFLQMYNFDQQYVIRFQLIGVVMCALKFIIWSNISSVLNICVTACLCSLTIIPSSGHSVKKS